MFCSEPSPNEVGPKIPSPLQELEGGLQILHPTLILYNTGGCLFCVLVSHKFYIELALPISPEIMDRF